jgi:lambda repressor-like predicted transcriptional regulator
MAPNAFADNEMMRGDDKGGMRMEKMGEKMKDKMGNKGEHMGQVADQYLQSILGMTTEQFRAELQSGKTVKDIIAAKGLNFETVMKQVREKHEADMKTKLAADVASGKITQAQADQMLKQRTEMETKQLTLMATALGTTVDKLKADITSGKSIDETIKSLGLTKAQAMQKIRDARMADMKTKLAADVASGKITQAQADQMLKKMIDNETKRDTVVAKALGITVDELTALTASGKTIEQIATEKGISADTIKKTIDNQMQELGKDKKKGIVKKIKNMFKKKTAAPAVVAPTSTVQ